MTSRPFLPSQISDAKENAFLHGVREVVPDGVAIAFLTWRSRQDYPSHDKTKGYWGTFYNLVD